MVQIVLVGLGAGTAAALLFASIISGSTLAMVLLLLAPLPILIVTLGWSHWAGLVAAAAAAVCLAAVGLDFVVAFLLAVALPAWWLGYLAMLARPVPTAEGQEWYPVGRLTLWAACINALFVGLTLINLGPDLASLQSALVSVLDSQLDDVITQQFDNPEEATQFVNAIVMIVPAAAAVAFTLSCLGNLWLAGRIVKISGRLQRPWPRLSDMRLPKLAPALLGAAIAGAFLPDLAGIASRALAASLTAAHVLLGLAVIHALTIGLPGRGFTLGCVYAAIVVFSWPIRWPILIIALIGITDAVLDLRALIGRRRAPPAAPT